KQEKERQLHLQRAKIRIEKNRKELAKERERNRKVAEELNREVVRYRAMRAIVDPLLDEIYKLEKDQAVRDRATQFDDFVIDLGGKTNEEMDRVQNDVNNTITWFQNRLNYLRKQNKKKNGNGNNGKQSPTSNQRQPPSNAPPPNPSGNLNNTADSTSLLKATEKRKSKTEEKYIQDRQKAYLKIVECYGKLVIHARGMQLSESMVNRIARMEKLIKQFETAADIARTSIFHEIKMLAGLSLTIIRIHQPNYEFQHLEVSDITSTVESDSKTSDNENGSNDNDNENSNSNNNNNDNSGNTSNNSNTNTDVIEFSKEQHPPPPVAPAKAIETISKLDPKKHQLQTPRSQLQIWGYTHNLSNQNPPGDGSGLATLHKYGNINTIPEHLQLTEDEIMVEQKNIPQLIHHTSTTYFEATPQEPIEERPAQMPRHSRKKQRSINAHMAPGRQSDHSRRTRSYSRSPSSESKRSESDTNANSNRRSRRSRRSSGAGNNDNNGNANPHGGNGNGNNNNNNNNNGNNQNQPNSQLANAIPSNLALANPLWQSVFNTNQFLAILLQDQLQQKRKDDDTTFSEKKRNQEYYKRIEQARVDSDLHLKFTHKLGATGPNPLDAAIYQLEWFDEATHFITDSRLLKYDEEYGIRTICEQGMQKRIYNVYREYVRDMGHFKTWDDFGHWLFAEFKIGQDVITELRQRLYNFRFQDNLPPTEILRPYKRLLNLLNTALLCVYGPIDDEIKDSEKKYAQRAQVLLPPTYKQWVKGITHAGKQPWYVETMAQLQQLIVMAWDNKIEYESKFHNPYRQSKKSQSDGIMGKRINAFQQSRDDRRGYQGRGRRGGRYRGRGRQRFAGQRTRGRGDSRYRNKDRYGNRGNRDRRYRDKKRGGRYGYTRGRNPKRRRQYPRKRNDDGNDRDRRDRSTGRGRGRG
ncbi:MAG: hypothetical protein ACPG2Y_01255, partial [Acholeplasmataceae bacterium]